MITELTRKVDIYNTVLVSKRISKYNIVYGMFIHNFKELSVIEISDLTINEK